jgi:hypothetical protein
MGSDKGKDKLDAELDDYWAAKGKEADGEGDEGADDGAVEEGEGDEEIQE